MSIRLSPAEAFVLNEDDITGSNTSPTYGGFPDFWSSMSVVESLFKDEKISQFSSTSDSLYSDWSDDDDYGDISSSSSARNISSAKSNQSSSNSITSIGKSDGFLYSSGVVVPQITSGSTITGGVGAGSSSVRNNNNSHFHHQIFAGVSPSKMTVLHFQNLPTSLLFHILSFLAAKELAHLEQVCKKMRNLATENSLWKELYMSRWKLLETYNPQLVIEASASLSASDSLPITVATGSKGGNSRGHSPAQVSRDDDGDSENSGQDEWAWIYSLLQQNERWKDIYKVRSAAEQWRVGTLKMFNGCWGFISQVSEEGASEVPVVGGVASSSSGVIVGGVVDQLQDSNKAGNGTVSFTALDIFFHRKDICPDGAWYEDWWLQDTPGVSRSQKCGYWDTFLYGRKVRYKQRAAYAQGRRPQACQISFLDQQQEGVANRDNGSMKAYRTEMMVSMGESSLIQGASINAVHSSPASPHALSPHLGGGMNHMVHMHSPNTMGGRGSGPMRYSPNNNDVVAMGMNHHHPRGPMSSVPHSSIGGNPNIIEGMSHIVQMHPHSHVHQNGKGMGNRSAHGVGSPGTIGSNPKNAVGRRDSGQHGLYNPSNVGDGVYTPKQRNSYSQPNHSTPYSSFMRRR